MAWLSIQDPLSYTNDGYCLIDEASWMVDAIDSVGTFCGCTAPLPLLDASCDWWSTLTALITIAPWTVDAIDSDGTFLWLHGTTTTEGRVSCDWKPSLKGAISGGMFRQRRNISTRSIAPSTLLSATTSPVSSPCSEGSAIPRLLPRVWARFVGWS